MADQKTQEFEHAIVTELADRRGTSISFKSKPQLVEFSPEKAPKLQCQFYPLKGTKIYFSLSEDFMKANSGQISNSEADVIARIPPSGDWDWFSWEGKGEVDEQSTKYFTTRFENALAANPKIFNEAAKRVGVVFDCPSFLCQICQKGLGCAK